MSHPYVTLQDEPEALTGKTFAVMIDEESVNVPSVTCEPRSCLLDVSLDGLDGPPVDWELALASSSAQNAYVSGIQVNVAGVKAHELAHAQAGCGEELEHCCVALILETRSVWLCKETSDLIDGQGPWESLVDLRRVEFLGRVLIDDALGNQPVEERLDGRNLAGERC